MRDFRGVEFGLQGRNRLEGTRGDHQRRRVDGGDFGAVGQEFLQTRLGGPYAQHCAGGALLHQATTGGDQTQSVVVRHDTGEAGGDELTEAVPDHCVGLDAAADQQLGERVLDDEQRRLRKYGRADRMWRVFVGRNIFAEQQRQQVGAGQRFEQGCACVDVAAEDGFGLIEAFGHARVLSALAGKHEDDLCVGFGANGGGRNRAQFDDRLFCARRSDSRAAIEAAAADQRRRHVAKLHAGHARQKVRQIGGKSRDGFRVARR